MPQLPAEFRRQYRELGLPAADVLVLADELPTAQFFDAVLAAGTPAKPAANWIMGDIMAFCKASLLFCSAVLVRKSTDVVPIPVTAMLYLFTVCCLCVGCHCSTFLHSTYCAMYNQIEQCDAVG